MNLKKYSSNEIINKIDNVINELNTIKTMIKDTNDFNDVLITEEVNLSKFKETEKTLKPQKQNKDNQKIQVDFGYKDYLDKDSMPTNMY